MLRAHRSSVAPVLLAILLMTLIGLLPFAAVSAGESRPTAVCGESTRTQSMDAGLSLVPGILGETNASVHGATMRARCATDRGAEVGLRAGWPVTLGTPGGGFPYTPTLYDVDGDGADEIFMTGGHTFGLRGDGTFLPGWPTAEMADMGYGTNDNKPGPSVADLDGSGSPEILWSERDWYAGSSHMWCFNGKYVDGLNLPGFPQEAIDGFSNALDVPFVLGDTDGDGDLEAWGPHTLGNNFVHYRISAFDALGNRLFTTNLRRTENILSLYFGNLDGNGGHEMFAVSWLSPDYRLHVFTASGAEAAGYPITLYTLTDGWSPFGPPIVADLDGDADLEILLGQWDSVGSRVHGRHHDGSAVAGFPIEIATASQLFYFNLGDVTGDGAPELIATDNDLSNGYRIHVLSLATGLPLPGWPVSIANWPEGFPAIADITDDGVQDVCFVTGGGELIALTSGGALIPGYPRMMIAPSISGVAVGDIDADGLFELVAATWDGWVYAWDTPGAALPERADWPMRNVNARNTGIFGDDASSASIAASDSRAPRLLEVAPSITRGAITFACAPTLAGARVEICSADGRRITTLSGEGTARIPWNAAAGEPAGVYYARLTGERASQPVRFVLVR
jgi:hypothetical protein